MAFFICLALILGFASLLFFKLNNRDKKEKEFPIYFEFKKILEFSAPYITGFKWLAPFKDSFETENSFITPLIFLRLKK